jgi:hypothetical protein
MMAVREEKAQMILGSSLGLCLYFKKNFRENYVSFKIINESQSTHQFPTE